MGRTYHNLQALRGIACLLVVVYHASGFEHRYGPSVAPLSPFRWFGYAGVDLFFVLSGFIIATTSRADLGRPGRLPRYAFRRVWRIYPAYWVALALAVGVFAVFNPDQVFQSGWAAELGDALLLVPRNEMCRFLAVSWTLSFELCFYLAFAVLFLVPRRLAGPLLVGWAGLVVWATVVRHIPVNRFAQLPVSPYVLEFLAGALVAWRVPLLTGRQAAALVAVAVAWCGSGIAATFDADPSRMAINGQQRVVVFGVAAALLVLAAAGWERGGGRTRWRRLERVGDASYSIYLTHIPCMIVVEFLAVGVNWQHTRLPHFGWIGMQLAAGVVPGLLMYRAVEVPLLRLVKGKRPMPTPAAAPEPVPLRRAA